MGIRVHLIKWLNDKFNNLNNDSFRFNNCSSIFKGGEISEYLL